MTKVAIIGAGPCGLSMLRAFELAEKNGEKIVCFTKLIFLFSVSWKNIEN